MTRSIVIPPDNGVFAGIENLDYHADTTSLSSSGARLLVPPSCPAKFKQRMDGPPEYKQVFDFGTVAHSLVLGEGCDFVAIDAPDYRSKAAQTERDKIRKDNKTPILQSELERATAMAAVAWTHPVAGEILGAKGQAETSLYVDDPETGVRLRARPDWMTDAYDPSRLWIVDYKTTITARPEDFARKATDFGYHMQAAWYIDVAIWLGLSDQPAFVFVAQEKEPPYLVSVVEFDAEAIEEGRALNRQAINLFKYCTDNDVWPGYGDDIHPISLPHWAFKAQRTIGDVMAGA